MRTIASALTALVLVLLLAAPVFAGGNGEDMVTKTFRLSINANTVESGRVFGVFYARQGEKEPTVVQFCGPVVRGDQPGSVRRVSEAPCTGDGTVYKFDAQFERGTKLAFEFVTLMANDPEHTFQPISGSLSGDEDGGPPNGPEDFETLNDDMTNSASYTAAGMPDTGGGGMAEGGATLPIGSIAATVSLLMVMVGGGYTVLRLR
ncbi:MAG: hypothetical protein M3Q29_12920 [Chloroflexota bacterium]|nr:hypothetical protein [Chloroflexota bacterium]